MELEKVFGLIAFFGLIFLGGSAIFGVVNITLAIVLSALYIGANIWLGLNKIAKNISK